MLEDVFGKLSDSCKSSFGKCDTVLAGVGGLFKVLGNVCVRTNIEGAVYNLVYVVVPTKGMLSPLLIDDPILNFASVNLHRDGPRIVPFIGQDYIQLLQVEEREISQEMTAHLAEPYRSAAAALIKNYYPQNLPKEADTEVKLHVRVKDSRPIYSRPRRLSPEAEDAVNEQIEDW